MKTTKAIIERIKTFEEGRIFTYSDLQLPPEMQAAVAMSLSRMVAENKIKKIGKGKFYKPVYSRLGEMAPYIDELTKDLLYKDGKIIGYLTGFPIFAEMGLTTQISSKVLIGSKNYRRPFVRGGYEISFTRQENPLTENNIVLLRYLDAIKFIKKIPACTPDEAVKILISKMSKFPKNIIDILIQLVFSYPASTRALLGSMLASMGFYSSKLKATINPLTKFNIGISEETLPNKKQWNIV